MARILILVAAMTLGTAMASEATANGGAAQKTAVQKSAAQKGAVQKAGYAKARRRPLRAFRVFRPRRARSCSRGSCG
jgi:hypothetical protein